MIYFEIHSVIFNNFYFTFYRFHNTFNKIYQGYDYLRIISGFNLLIIAYRIVTLEINCNP